MQTALIHKEICHLTHKAMLLPQVDCKGTPIRFSMRERVVDIATPLWLTLRRTSFFSEPDHATM